MPIKIPQTLVDELVRLNVISAEDTTTFSDNLKIFENLKIDFSILDNNKYKALQIFGESPVSPGVTGKKDLFAPI